MFYMSYPENYSFYVYLTNAASLIISLYQHFLKEIKVPFVFGFDKDKKMEGVISSNLYLRLK